MICPIVTQLLGSHTWYARVYCDCGEINVLDSLGFVSVQEDAILQIAKLYSDNSTLYIKRLSVQQQNGFQ